MISLLQFGDGFLYDVIERWIEINQSVKYCDVLFFAMLPKLIKQYSVIINFFLEKKALSNLVKNFY